MENYLYMLKKEEELKKTLIVTKKEKDKSKMERQ